MSMRNVPWADDEELRNERPKLRPDLPFGQSPPPPDMQSPMDRPFGGDMAQLQSNADANANPQLGSPLSSWKESPLVARARELREKATIAESIGDQAMARTQKRPIGVTDKMYRQLESNAKKGADPKLESPIASKGGMEFSRGDGLIRDFPENEPTDAELEKRMGEGPKAKEVAKWDEEYGGHAAAARPKKAEGGKKSRKDHMADVTAALARLKASKRGTKDEDPRSYGPWADNYDVGDPHPYVTSDARAKREAYELGKQHGVQDSRRVHKADGTTSEVGDGEQRMEYRADGTAAPQGEARRVTHADGTVREWDQAGNYSYKADGSAEKLPGGPGAPAQAPQTEYQERGMADRAATVLTNATGNPRVIPDAVLARAGIQPGKAQGVTPAGVLLNSTGSPRVIPDAIMARLRGKK